MALPRTSAVGLITLLGHWYGEKSCDTCQYVSFLSLFGTIRGRLDGSIKTLS